MKYGIFTNKMTGTHWVKGATTHCPLARFLNGDLTTETHKPLSVAFAVPWEFLV